MSRRRKRRHVSIPIDGPIHQGGLWLVRATPILVGRLYGLSHVGVIARLITTVHHLAGGLWAYWGGVIFDRTGSYQSAFYVSAIMVVVALVSSLLIREQRHAAPSP